MVDKAVARPALRASPWILSLDGTEGRKHCESLRSRPPDLEDGTEGQTRGPKREERSHVENAFMERIKAANISRVTDLHHSSLIVSIDSITHEPERRQASNP